MSLDGVILVDKTSGPTSHDLVDDLRRILKTKAIGHGGTLDPLATGLLVCLIGEATKLSQYVMNEEKSYVVGIQFGIQTDSGDITGKVIEEKSSSAVTQKLIEDLLPALQGEVSLAVPKYSAVKVNGKKLYEYARKNEEVDLPIKIMTIDAVRLLNFTPSDSINSAKLDLEFDCEKGTYVRSWVEELGRRLGCGATVHSLRRIGSGSFKVSNAKTIENLKLSQDVGNEIIPLHDVLGHWPALKVMGRDHSLMLNGQIPKGIYSQILHFDFGEGVRILYPEGGLLALLVKDQEKGIKLARVFNQ